MNPSPTSALSEFSKKPEFSKSPLATAPSNERPLHATVRNLITRARLWLGKVVSSAFARYLIAFFIGVTATLAWQSYGGAAKKTIAPAAPSPDQQQLNAMSLDLDAVRQSIDRIAASIAASQEQITRSVDRIAASITTSQEQTTRSVTRLAAGQEWMTRDFTTKLQVVEQDILDKISAPPPRPAPAPARNPVLRPSQAPIPLTPARNP